MRIEDEVKVGQVWKGTVVSGFRKVIILRLGDQPKIKRYTVKYLEGGFTCKLTENQLRGRFLLQEESHYLIPPHVAPVVSLEEAVIDE